MLKKFKYKKENGEISDRTIYVISSPTDLWFGIDLSSFEEEEQEKYYKELYTAYDDFKKVILSLELQGKYRNFKKDRIIE